MAAGTRGMVGKLIRSRGTWGLAASVGLVAAAAWAVRDVPAALGSAPSGGRAERLRRSPQYRDGAFHNRLSTHTMPAGSGGQLLRDAFVGPHRRKPSGPVPLLTPTTGPVPADALHVIWYGHSSALVEIEGRRVLFDPVWSERCSPSMLAGPRRLHPPPVPLEELPELDAIVISHDHYDHLDMATVRTLAREQTAPFLIPLGVGGHLERWGLPPHRIIELDWDESTTIGDLRLTATQARHFSGRTLRRDTTLWASWVLTGRTHRLFYTGDSGYFDGYAGIGAQYGPFDATLMQIGAYSPGWPEIHMTPEEAIQAHRDLGGGLLIPLHWATFVLAFHDWADPVERLWREAKALDVRLAIPRPGERVDIADPPPVDGWWQSIA